MKIFISWSGQRANHVAKALRKWIPKIVQGVEPWMSEEDIQPGARWARDLAQTLETTQFGVICLTPETINRPWVLFEAGALSKALDQATVCPYLIELETEALQGPMSQFNSVRADDQGTLKLLRCLNRNLDHPLSDDLLLETFTKWWPDLEQSLKNLPKRPPEHSVLFTDVSNLGLQFVYEDRGPALERFRVYLDDEIKRAQQKQSACISLVGTSARGFLVPALLGFHGRELLEAAIEAKCELRMMLVHPVIASLREAPEHRGTGQIARDIFQSFEELRQIGVPRGFVRYYRTGPTVFGIATSEWMLLNPYPTANESQHLFTLVVQNTGTSRDIYQRYKKYHFDDLWENHSQEVPESHWICSRGDDECSKRIMQDVFDLQTLVGNETPSPISFQSDDERLRSQEPIARRPRTQA